MSAVPPATAERAHTSLQTHKKLKPKSNKLDIFHSFRLTFIIVVFRSARRQLRVPEPAPSVRVFVVAFNGFCFYLRVVVSSDIFFLCVCVCRSVRFGRLIGSAKCHQVFDVPQRHARHERISMMISSHACTH